LYQDKKTKHVSRGSWVFALFALTGVLLSPCELFAQQFTPAEIGIDGSALSGNRAPLATELRLPTDFGLGARFTYNFSPSFAIDSQFDGYFDNIQGTQRSVQQGGRATMAVAGIKSGFRSRSYGVFFAARPGILTFSDASVFGSPTATKRISHFALDLGIASEFYPTARTILRVDAGALLVRYGDALLFRDPVSGNTVRSIGGVSAPWHISVGASYRLGRLQEKEERSPEPGRFEFGGQYSLIILERSLRTLSDESGVGGWATWNFNKYVALDSGVLFLPSLYRVADLQQGGRIVQTLFGLRGGIRRGRLGIYAKFRPGLQIYTLTEQAVGTSNYTDFTNVAFDAGGIVEVYTSRHTLLRFDVGDTIVHFRARDITLSDGTPFHVGGFTNNTIQITAGFGFRF